MQKRTFIRIMLDIFLNNSLAKSIKYFVNFCYEKRFYGTHELKFLKNVPINKMLTNVTKIHQNRQLYNPACFIIHVGLCIGVKAYA